MRRLTMLLTFLVTVAVLATIVTVSSCAGNGSSPNPLPSSGPSQPSALSGQRTGQALPRMLFTDGIVPSFAGTPGQPNCIGQSESALARQYAGLASASQVLGYS